MKELIEKLWKLRDKLKKYGDELENLEGDPGFFGMCFNDVTLTLEVISYYYDAWKNPRQQVSQEEIDQIKDQNAERIMVITKWMFIAIVSGLEFDAKNRVKVTKRSEFNEIKNKLSQGDWIYFGEIIKTSRDNQLLPHERFNELDAILYLRHCLIHNNGISEKDSLYAPIKKKLKTFKEGKMIQGNLLTFYELSDMIIDYYNDWINQFRDRT